MDKHICEIPLRVLLYKEDGEFVAHALEMDLLGYGASEKAATEDLESLVVCQLIFAHQKADDSLLLFPAPKEFFNRWEAARVAALKKEVMGDKSIKLEAKAIVISIPGEKLKSSPKAFHPANNLACA